MRPALLALGALGADLCGVEIPHFPRGANVLPFALPPGFKLPLDLEDEPVAFQAPAEYLPSLSLGRS